MPVSLSVFDHPFLSGLLGDDEVADHLSAAADIRAMLSFEAALAETEAEHGIVPDAAAKHIAQVCATFQPDIARLKTATARDGLALPDLIKQLRAAVGEDYAQHVHVGGTSQDVIDTSLIIRLKAISTIFAARLETLAAALETLDREFGSNALMGQTRMQAAIPITVSDRIVSWRASLLSLHERLTQFNWPVQFGGAAGTLEKFGDKAASMRTSLARELQLADVPQWHTQRGVIADIAGLFSLITGSIGKIGQDIALMALAGNEIELAGGGGSSAMPHKQNPIAAEALVALARFNATQVSGIHQSLIAEQERSGAAWTLEWMILPLMAMAAAASLRLANELTGNVRRLGLLPNG